jgi:hypothetical protein
MMRCDLSAQSRADHTRFREITMRRILYPAAALAVTLMITLAAAQTKDEDGRPQADANDWAKAAAPDEHHERLAALVGKWNQVIKAQSEPGGPWQEWKGTATYRAILGGRFIVEEVKCELQGESFEWMGVYGFDKLKGKYTAVWFDNFDTGTEQGEAAAEPTGKIFAFSGEQVVPPAGEKKKFRWVMTLESQDKLRIDMFEPGPDGKEAKVLEIEQTRAP